LKPPNAIRAAPKNRSEGVYAHARRKIPAASRDAQEPRAPGWKPDRGEHIAACADQIAGRDREITARWRKRKGIAHVRLSDGSIHAAELHRYEAAGIGRKEFKIKHLF